MVFENSLCAIEQVRKKDTMKTSENIKAKFLILNMCNFISGSMKAIIIVVIK
jgi:hypothetical protein